MMNSSWLLGLALVLTGCTTYRDQFTPPVSESGRMCAANCSASRQSCELLQQSVSQSYALQCADNYRKAMDSYQQCNAMNPPGRCSAWRSVTKEVNGRTVTEQQCTTTTYSNSCVKPEACRTTSNAGSCEPNYKACFVSCGGRIDRVEN